MSFHFERNIVFWDNNGPLLGGCHSASVPCEINFKLDHNVYWNAAGEPPVFPGNLNLDQWRERDQDRHSLVADPLFADAKNGNFQLQPASPARAPAGACDAGPANFTIITDGNNLFGGNVYRVS